MRARQQNDVGHWADGWNDIATFFLVHFAFRSLVCIISLYKNRKKPISIGSLVLFIFSSKKFLRQSVSIRSFVLRWPHTHQTGSLLFRHLRGYYFNDRLQQFPGFSCICFVFACFTSSAFLFAVAFIAFTVCWLHCDCFDRLVNSKISSNYLLIIHCFVRSRHKNQIFSSDP